MNNVKPVKANPNKRYSTPSNFSKLRKNKSTDYIQANYLNEEYSKDFTHGEISKRSKDDYKNDEQNTNSKNYFLILIEGNFIFPFFTLVDILLIRLLYLFF